MSLLVEGLDDYRNKYSDISEYLFDEIISLDPTYDANVDDVGIYGDWLLKLYTNKIITERDFNRIPTILNACEKYKNYNFNVNIFNTLDDLREYVIEAKEEFETDDTYVKNELKRQKNKSLGDQLELVYSDSEWSVYIPKTHAALVEIGKYTNWDAAEDSGAGKRSFNDLFENGGTPYVLIDKQHSSKFTNRDSIYLLNFENGTCCDGTSRRIAFESMFDLDSEILKFFNRIIAKKINNNDKLTKIYEDNDYAIYKTQYIDILGLFFVDVSSVDYYNGGDYIVVKCKNTGEVAFFDLGDLVVYKSDLVYGTDVYTFDDMFTNFYGGQDVLKPLITNILKENLSRLKNGQINGDTFTINIEMSDILESLDTFASNNSMNRDFIACVADEESSDWYSMCDFSSIDPSDCGSDYDENDLGPGIMDKLSKLGLTIQDFKDIWNERYSDDIDYKLSERVHEAIRLALIDGYTEGSLDQARYLLWESISNKVGCKVDRTDYPTVKFTGPIDSFIDAIYECNNNDCYRRLNNLDDVILDAIEDIDFDEPYGGFDEFSEDAFYNYLEDLLTEIVSDFGKDK